jgi:branched-chain amino acid transport system substrate-binding protein
VSARGFLQKFAAHHPGLLLAPQYAAEAYDCASLLIQALRRAGMIDRRAVLNAFGEIGRYTGASGEIRFDGSGDRLNPEISLYRCEDGHRKCIGKTSDLVKRVSQGPGK